MHYTPQILQYSDLESYKGLIDECFGSSNAIEQYKTYSQEKDYTIWGEAFWRNYCKRHSISNYFVYIWLSTLYNAF